MFKVKNKSKHCNGKQFLTIAEKKLLNITYEKNRFRKPRIVTLFFYGDRKLLR